MKLNNKGWGLMTFLFILIFLLFIILLITVMANEFDNGLPSSSRRHLEVVNK